MEIRRLTEKNGQSQCFRCKELGIWHVEWTSFMYKIEGCPGHYCWACAHDIEARERKVKYEQYVKEVEAYVKAEMKGE